MDNLNKDEQEVPQGGILETGTILTTEPPEVTSIPEARVEEMNDRDRLYFDARLDYYEKQGLKEIEAATAANFDLNEFRQKQEEQGNELWSRLVKETKADKLLHDQLLRALGIYKTEWEKKNPGQLIDFKLRFETHGTITDKKGAIKRISAVTLIFEVGKNGLFSVWNKKRIDFHHVREMRDGHNWKLSLYEALFVDFVMSGMTFRMIQEEFKGEKGAKLILDGAKNSEPAKSS